MVWTPTLEDGEITGAVVVFRDIFGPGGAAQLLGVKPSTLAYRIKVFDIEKGRGPGISYH